MNGNLVTIRHHWLLGDGRLGICRESVGKASEAEEVWLTTRSGFIRYPSGAAVVVEGRFGGGGSVGGPEGGSMVSWGAGGGCWGRAGVDSGPLRVG